MKSQNAWLGRFAAFGLIAVVPMSANAQQTVNFWFALQGDATATPISNLQIGVPGSVFNVSVWYQTPGGFTHNALNGFIGFDRTNTTGMGATPLDNLLTLNGTPSTAVTNVNTSYNVQFTRVLAGGEGAGTRPFGVDIPLGILDNSITSTTPIRAFDISLANQSLQVGQSTNVWIWNGGTGSEFTTFITNGVTTLRPDTFTMQVTAVPEPTTLAALALGGAFLARRRRRQS
jgi:hypothetical protein